jgi:outer membrane usher protein
VVFASNKIEDSFAVVDVGSLSHVHVRLEDRDIGVSDATGRILIPSLQSYSLNHISIEPTDVPVDMLVGETERDVRPPDRAGVLVRFNVKQSYSALLKVVDDAGVPIPMVSTAEVSGAQYPVGYDGEVYLTDLREKNEVTVSLPDFSACRIQFPFHHVSAVVPTLGPLRCVVRR